MKRILTYATGTALFAALPSFAQEAKTYPAPGEIVAAAKAEEWIAIAPSDLLVMDLAPDAKSKPRRVVIQLMPAPFSQGWIGNIRKLATAKWWDGTSINRVQDNYVVQWGDATDKKALPEGLAVVPESAYATQYVPGAIARRWEGNVVTQAVTVGPRYGGSIYPEGPNIYDSFSQSYSFVSGIPLALSKNRVVTDTSITVTPHEIWPVHCYGMVGVGRNLSPDTGIGAELYTVIGHAPRHLDRNIALVGRVIEGIEHLSSLPRGTGALGFYEKDEERVPIISVRLGNAANDVPAFEYLSTESASFTAYANARANRRDPFFIRPAGGTDICNIPVPVRRKPVK
ncbi:MAG: peptidylprolyl isomerase [Sphingorhabdus sp.]|uniref:peptidylprolyl isomerase n=1 Tax=Sphingorhabdus sp. TaxID=1902408 RepID=UPI0038FC892D